MPVSPSRLCAWCAEEGFPRTGFVHSSRLPASLRAYPEIAALGAGTYLLAALSCFRREAEDLSVPGEPHGLIAPFARRNYYREAVLRLRRVAGRLAPAAGLARRELRIFCNSRLPEKPLAAASGLGSYGKNALVLAPGLGSVFVIAGMFVPGEPPGELSREPPGELSREPPGELSSEPPGPVADPQAGPAVGRLCGECRACQDACPVGALQEPGRLDDSRCLQAQAGRHGDLPEELSSAWGFRLYGCQVCQEVCPYNRRLEHETLTAVGELGPSVPLRRVLEPTPEELADGLRGTALGMSWISKRALQRNALLALAHRVRSGYPVAPELWRLLESYRGHRDGVLARAAGGGGAGCGAAGGGAPAGDGAPAGGGPASRETR